MPTASPLQMSAHKMIASWGGIGQLIRDNVPSDATMAITDYTPAERNAFQVDDTTKIRISMIGIPYNPDASLDVISFGGIIYTIKGKPRCPKPEGVPIYWDCDCLATYSGS